MTEEELRQHLADRHMHVRNYSGVWFGEGVVVFGLWNLTGQLVGYQQYRPFAPKTRSNDPKDGRYYTLCSKDGGRGAVTAWGLETVRGDKPILLCEGIFDACRLHALGVPALALLGSDPVHLRQWLSLFSQPLVSVVQGDEAGKKLAKYAGTGVQLPEGHDVGSLPEQDFRRIFNRFTE
jgi:hypothetical protein